MLTSKKFWMSIAGVVAVVASEYLGLPEDTVMQVAGIIIAYVLGQGIADHGKEAKKLEYDNGD